MTEVIIWIVLIIFWIVVALPRWDRSYGWRTILAWWLAWSHRGLGNWFEIAMFTIFSMIALNATVRWCRGEKPNKAFHE
jgi:hypothetical protein